MCVCACVCVCVFYLADIEITKTQAVLKPTRLLEQGFTSFFYFVSSVSAPVLGFFFSLPLLSFVCFVSSSHDACK